MYTAAVSPHLCEPALHRHHTHTHLQSRAHVGPHICLRVGPHSVKPDPGFWWQIATALHRKVRWLWLLERQETGNLHRTDLLSTNQRVPPNVNEKRRLSAHRAPSPCLTLSASLSRVSCTLSLNLSLSFHESIFPPSAVFLFSPPTPHKHASTPVCGHLFSCSVDVCGSVGTCVGAWVLKLCKVTDCVFFFVSFLLSLPLQDTWCCRRGNLSSQPEHILRQAKHNPKCS